VLGANKMKSKEITISIIILFLIAFNSPSKPADDSLNLIYLNIELNKKSKDYPKIIYYERINIIKNKFILVSSSLFGEKGNLSFVATDGGPEGAITKGDVIRDTNGIIILKGIKKPNEYSRNKIDTIEFKLKPINKLNEENQIWELIGYYNPFNNRTYLKTP
jgi:hypothetical protein